MAASTDLQAQVAGVALVDHHVHSTWLGTPGVAEVADLIRESGRPLAPGLDAFESPLGFAIRRHCAPLLDLPPHASAEAYLHRRAQFSAEELTRTFLYRAGVDTWLVDTGFRGEHLFTLPALQSLVPGMAHEIVRLETLLEDIALEVSPPKMITSFQNRLADLAANSAGWKSIVAYRHGLDFDPRRPTRDDVQAALDQWSGAEGPRGPVKDPTLLRFLLWEAVETGKPLQLHTGFGDADLNLAAANPSLLTKWLRNIEHVSGPIMLLHTYPFHRQAAYLAHVYPHVYFDVGLGMHYSAAGSTAILRESLELAPFGKLLYSSDGWGLPEMHYLGSHYWRQALATVLEDRVSQDEWSATDALRVAELVCAENARRVYGIL